MLSVIVPVYNVEKFLGKCLDSIISQTYKDLEIILIDDGSTDSSGQICDEYAENYSNVIVYHQENQGVSVARNKGLELASGDLITFVDSDDSIEPDMYELLIENLNKYKVDISHCGFKRVQNGEISKLVSGTNELVIQKKNEALISMLTGQYFVPSLWNKVFKKELFDGVLFPVGIKNNEDILVAVYVFNNSTKSVFIDKTLYNYCIHDESACSTTNAIKKSEDACFVNKQIFQLTRNNDELKSIVTERYLRSLCDCLKLYHQNKIIKEKRNRIKKEIREVSAQCSELGKRTKLSCFGVCKTPHLYILLYSLYDKIRKPNWDVK